MIGPCVDPFNMIDNQEAENVCRCILFFEKESPNARN
jgi:hypothetical protein